MSRAEHDALRREYQQQKAEYDRLRQAEPRRAARPPPQRRRLYLVARRGPAAFAVADGQRVLNVALGSPHTCACSQHGGSQHGGSPCEHISWVLTRCLGLGAASAGLSEAELARCIAAAAPLRHLAKPAARVHGNRRPSFDGQTASWLLDMPTSDAWLLAQPKLPPEEVPTAGAVPRRPLDDAPTCPVCMDDLPAAGKGVDEVTWCRRGCGKSVHRDCLARWSAHQPDSQTSCPMCRAPWADDERASWPLPAHHHARLRQSLQEAPAHSLAVSSAQPGT